MACLGQQAAALLNMIVGLSAAGLYYYVPNGGANPGPDFLCYIDAAAAPACAFGCLDVAALTAASGLDAQGLCQKAMSYEP